jgi:flagellar biosynthesis protein
MSDDTRDSGSPPRGARPPRVAVALEYGQRTAPAVVARGTDGLAERIVETARQAGVHVAEDPALVALLARLEIGEEIPPRLYEAVAVALSWAYWIKGMAPGDERR